MEIENKYLKFIIIVVLIGIIFEFVIIGIAYFGADEIKCNFIWCEFTKTKTINNENNVCYKNGLKINCSNLNNNFINYTKFNNMFYDDWNTTYKTKDKPLIRIPNWDNKSFVCCCKNVTQIELECYEDLTMCNEREYCKYNLDKHGYIEENIKWWN